MPLVRRSWPIFMGGGEDCGYDHSCHGRGRHGRDRAGGLSAYLFRRGTDRTVSVLLSFAAGMMLAVVCADLLADAIQAGPGLSALPAASASVLAGCGGSGSWKSW